jgi:hypothetical protein
LALALALALPAWLAGGCGQGPQDQAAVDPSEVRGEPIQAPVVEPAVAEVEVKPADPDSSVAVEQAVDSGASDLANGTAIAAAVESEVKAEAMEEKAEEKGTPEHPLEVGFDRLAAFQYDLPEGPVDTAVVEDTGAKAQIPGSIKGLNDQFIALKGFMLPLKVEKGLVTELLLMRDQSMCCYGTVPRINEWVSVKMVGAGVKPLMDQAVTLFGKFKVGEMYENGYLVGIYEMAGERMAGALDM